LRGLGLPAAKSSALLPASAQPASFLRIEVVALGAGAGLPSEQLAAEP